MYICHPGNTQTLKHSSMQMC